MEKIAEAVPYRHRNNPVSLPDASTRTMRDKIEADCKYTISMYLIKECNLEVNISTEDRKANHCDGGEGTEQVNTK